MDIDSEDTDSNTSLQTRAREKRKPQLEKDTKPKEPRYTPVSIYEEKLLLKRLEACPGAVAMTPEARRLKRKLIVRQAKRDRGLPLFDLDQVVNAALLLVDGIYGAKEGGVSRLSAGQAMYRTTCQDFRILDRYQAVDVVML
ncbi:Cysteine-rich protein 2-binding protein [Saguinus oedipus]|uniref:Cysteine-rich protein 2-binding protein n=1 Tax=Saguinus oedipus TaxID=9490 RepID=A0ABQ9VJI4_SAGOE|nr:Cysteine-rich protein 2-binding protein [Saguinus oedipus]